MHCLKNEQFILIRFFPVMPRPGQTEVKFKNNLHNKGNFFFFTVNDQNANFI